MDIIEYLEDLSMLKFSEKERKNFENEFKTIVDFVGEIAKVDLDLESNDFTGRTMSEFRSDDVQKSMNREDALLNAPQQRDGAFVTPMVIE